MKYKRQFVITLEIEFESANTLTDDAGELAMVVVRAFEESEKRLVECSVWENRLAYKAIEGGLFVHQDTL